MPKKYSQSFRLGDVHVIKLEELARYRSESQVEVMRQMIDVAHKHMVKRREDLKAKRAQRAEVV